MQTSFFIRQSLEILFGPYKSPRILKPLDVYSAIMANSRIRAPTYLQSTLASVFLITLSTLFIPATLSLTLTAYLWTAFSGTALNSPKPIKVMRKTVLVTGARANKALSLARAFKQAGHRVILAEEEYWGTLSCARFSRAADAYYNLPDPSSDSQVYIDSIKALILAEDVDAWVPCSSVHATMVDAEAARQIQQLDLGGDYDGCCDTFIQHPSIAGILHWKDELLALLKELDFPIAHSRKVISVAQAADFLYSPEVLRDGHKYILKCLTLDDLARDDFTLLPLTTREETVAHLKRMPTPISQDTPFLLQRFLRGNEYCTHVAVRQGEITAFVACRSRELLMRYVDITTLGNSEERERAIEIEQWVRDFLKKWKARLIEDGRTEGWETELTGHFSFDFIKDETDGILYPLECNVVSALDFLPTNLLECTKYALQRAHTAVALFSETPTLADSYLMVPGKNGEPPLSRPAPDSSPRSWVSHAFPVALTQTFLRLPLIRLLPHSVWALIHPGLLLFVPPPNEVQKKNHSLYDPTAVIDPTLSPFPSDNPFTVLVKFFLGTFAPNFFLTSINAKHSLGNPVPPAPWVIEQDPYWEWNDPLPWFVLMHVTWVWMYVRLAWTGRKWRRVNVSTERVFEC